MIEPKEFLPLFYSLQNSDPAAIAFSIPPLNEGKYASEYAAFVADYSKLRIAKTDRLIAPYIARNTHGANVYKEVGKFLRGVGVKRFLDLGCGSGELLEELSDIDGAILAGVTIHTGEVEFARNVRGLPLVVPYDMRFVDSLFPPRSFDCVIAYASLQFIPFAERETLLAKIYVLLENGGIFVEVNYRGDTSTGIPDDICSRFSREFEIRSLDITGEVGTVRVFRKIRDFETNLVALSEAEIRQFIDINKVGHFELLLPDDALMYEKSISSSCRSEAKQSERRGNTFERMYFLAGDDCAQIQDIWRSSDIRQGRTINFEMQIGTGRNWSLLNDGEWPIRDYFSLRSSAYFFVVRNPAQVIVAYLELYCNDHTAVVHSTMADRNSLKLGVNKQLFLQAIRFLIERTSVRSLCYGIRESSYQPQLVMLRGFRFCP